MADGAITRGSTNSPFRSITGYIPVLLAGAALALVAGFLLTGPHAPDIVVENGIAREDEGVAAHLWQLLMVLQVPAIVLFACRWLAKDLLRTSVMIGLQIAAMACAAFPIWYLRM